MVVTRQPTVAAAKTAKGGVDLVKSQDAVTKAHERLRVAEEQRQAKEQADRAERARLQAENDRLAKERTEALERMHSTCMTDEFYERHDNKHGGFRHPDYPAMKARTEAALKAIQAAKEA